MSFSVKVLIKNGEAECENDSGLIAFEIECRSLVKQRSVVALF